MRPDPARWWNHRCAACVSTRVMLTALLVFAACPVRGHAVVVDTTAHRMQLCSAGEVVHGYAVAIGSGGAVPIAQRIGWAVTPLGTFTLAAPIASSQYHVFIPLLNPAPKRFTAWAIGLHGPPRNARLNGPSNAESDWTWGCIAVSSDEEIDQVSAWVRAHQVTRVEFR